MIERPFPDLTRYMAMPEAELQLAAQLAMAARGEARPLQPTASLGELRERFALPLPANGRDGLEVLRDLSDAATPGLAGSTDPGFMAWVIGGSHPVGVAADWMTSAWGQNGALYQCAPAAAVAEEVTGNWLKDLLQLPAGASVGFTTGATMAAFTCLAAARLAVLERIGCDIAKTGLAGAPPVSVFIADDAHVTNYAVLRYLGFGTDQIRRVPSTDDGTYELDALAAAMDADSAPAKIVIGQCGHIMTGACDDFVRLSAVCRKHRAWLHVDGAFGLWARASTRLRHVANGAELADSWSVDGHKWLQVPYDAGYAIVKDAAAHRAAMVMDAGYLLRDADTSRDPCDYVPELSRRARGFATWALIQTLGRRGIARMVERHCCAAQALAALLEPVAGITVVNRVWLNMLAIEFDGPPDAAVQMAERLNATGRYLVKTSGWRGRTVLRVSVISNETGERQIKRLARDIAAQWTELSDASEKAEA
ncbi:pyridoxal phosphate-dependent decarboxylase family protein [Croceicoccus bisphenolivorans]|uniref:pyridoxal phosphate-dependent decarboxylase family protein n=1 Tax=Croceicoccus bisphenolivorans TaxID=1783232 RepID=UPI000AD6CDBB|nr:pyridoxal-dependent decarboxylase [Croceicoccus bisphenolivorans]